MRLNGTAVAEDEYFCPGWTGYDKRVQYFSYDVTSLMRPRANNAIGAILADGWFAGEIHKSPL